MSTTLSNFSIEALADLDADLSAREAALAAEREALHGELVRRYGNNTIGTINTVDGAVTVKIVTPKNVSWCQAELSRRVTECLMHQRDWRDFIDEKLSVSESKWKAFPQSVRDWLMPARTEKPGKPRVTLTRKQAA